jgi:hypothetical protein
LNRKVSDDGGLGRSLIHQALQEIDEKQLDPEGKSTHVDSPMEKYILQVQTVTQGNTPNQITATAMPRNTKSSVMHRC